MNSFQVVTALEAIRGDIFDSCGNCNFLQQITITKGGFHSFQSVGKAYAFDGNAELPPESKLQRCALVIERIFLDARYRLAVNLCRNDNIFVLTIII